MNNLQISNSKPNTLYYVLDAFDRITDVGGAWSEAAPEGDRAKISKDQIRGCGMRDFVQGSEVIAFLNTVFFWCRFENRTYETLYRCDTPDTPRLFRMTIQPFADEQLIVEHRLISESKRTIPVSDENSAKFFGPKCSICCRYNIGTDWIDPFSGAPGNYSETDHVFCPECRNRLSAGLVARSDDTSRQSSFANN